MASAGTVSIDFAAETARFTAELKKVRSDLAGVKKSSDATAQSVEKITSGFKRLVGALALGAGIRAIIKNTQEAEQANALLANALETAGANVAAASADFADYATTLQRATTFGDEAIIGVETLLLSFRGLSSGVIKQATADILDLSARTGTDLPAAARSVGRALEDPIEGLTKLGKAGVIFTEAQKAQVKAFVEAGEKGKAQAVILGEIEARFKGAAAAAANTLGGALTGLKNDFGDLLEAKTGLSGATTELNKLRSILQDPATKQAADNLLAGLLQATVSLGSFLGKTIAGLKILATGEGGNEIVDTTLRIEELQRKRDVLLNTGVGARARASTAGRAAIQLQLDEINRQLDEAIKKEQQLLGLGAQSPKPATPAGKLAAEMDALNRERQAILNGRAAGDTNAGTGFFGQQTLEEIDTKLAEIQSRLRAIREEAAGDQRMQLLPLPWIGLQEIDLKPIQAMKIPVDELAEAYRQLDISAKAARQAQLDTIASGALEHEVEVQAQITEELQRQLDARASLAEFHRNEEVRREEAAQTAILALKKATFNNTLAALQAFSGHSKKIAIAAILLQKGQALKEAFLAGQVTIAKAAASAPPPANFGAIAWATAFTAANLAAIAATGIGQIQSIRAGGASLGSVANPIFTNPTDDDGQQFGAEARSVTQVIINGDVFSSQETVDYLIERIREAVDERDVVIIGGNSRNAQELMDS